MKFWKNGTKVWSRKIIGKTCDNIKTRNFYKDPAYWKALERQLDAKTNHRRLPSYISRILNDSMEEEQKRQWKYRPFKARRTRVQYRKMKERHYP